MAELSRVQLRIGDTTALPSLSPVAVDDLLGQHFENGAGFRRGEAGQLAAGLGGVLLGLAAGVLEGAVLSEVRPQCFALVVAGAAEDLPQPFSLLRRRLGQ